MKLKIEVEVESQKEADSFMKEFNEHFEVKESKEHHYQLVDHNGSPIDL